MTVSIEWVLEEMDGGEIVDVQHPESYQQALAWCDADARYRIGLVKDRIDCRSWAYIEDGVLAEYFTDSYGEEVGKVPTKYGREVRASKRRPTQTYIDEHDVRFYL